MNTYSKLNIPAKTPLSNCTNFEVIFLNMSQEEDTDLTKAQLARIEKNRQRALILKQTRLIPHPYAKG